MNSGKETPSRVLVIAEIGVNHNGDLNLAKRLIDVAHHSGADIAKFQVFNSEAMTTETAPAAEYQKKNIGHNVSQFEMLRKLELTVAEFQEIMEYCSQTGIEFMASGFSAENVETIVKLGARRLKIPSGEITNLPYLRAVAQQNLPTIMSTGMATLQEVFEAVGALTEAGLDHKQLTLLHCTTDYPADYSDANLRVIPALRDRVKLAVGYSDHTKGTSIAGAAVALGATVIEKHLTLDRNLPGPDHKASLEPEDFFRMVAQIRAIEQGLGFAEKKPTRAEKKNRLITRKSIVAATSIKQGETLGERNLTTKRPGTGVSPMKWDLICGQVAVRDYGPDDLIAQ